MNKVTILGSGLIGKSWVLDLISHKIPTTLWNPKTSSIKIAQKWISEELQKLEQIWPNRFNRSMFKYVTLTDDLSESLKSVDFVIECLPENLELKQNLFSHVEPLLSSDTIVTSSTSGILLSDLTSQLRTGERFLIAHPMNPPHLLPIVEIIKSEKTPDSLLKKTMEFFKKIQKSPVLLKKELPGFILNRLQYALVNEAIYLIQNGYIDPKDIDTILTDGLGLRWAVLGPLACMDANASCGFKSYVENYGQLIADGNNPKIGFKWEAPTVEAIEKWRRTEYDIPSLDKLRSLRDQGLIQIQKNRGI